MYRDSEMTVWFSGGVSLSRFVAPVLRLAWPVVLVVAHLDEAADAVEELLDLGVAACALPAMETAATDSAGGLETALERLRATDACSEPRVTVAPIAALMQTVAAPTRRERLRLRRVRRGRREGGHRGRRAPLSELSERRRCAVATFRT
jgi:hypothetical protein